MATPRKELFVSLIGLKDTASINAAESLKALATLNKTSAKNSDLPTGTLDMTVDAIKQEYEQPCSTFQPTFNFGPVGIDDGVSSTTVAPSGDSQSAAVKKSPAQRKIAKRKVVSGGSKNANQKVNTSSPVSSVSQSSKFSVRRSARQAPRPRRTLDLSSSSPQVKKKTPEKIVSTKKRSLDTGKTAVRASRQMTTSAKETGNRARQSASATRQKASSTLTRTNKRKSVTLIETDRHSAGKKQWGIVVDDSRKVDEDLYVADDRAYTIQPPTAKGGNIQLVDTQGFSYIVEGLAPMGQAVQTVWKCCDSSKAKSCPATVLQVDGYKFYRSREDHIHGVGSPAKGKSQTANKKGQAAKMEGQTTTVKGQTAKKTGQTALKKGPTAKNKGQSAQGKGDQTGKNKKQTSRPDVRKDSTTQEDTQQQHSRAPETSQSASIPSSTQALHDEEMHALCENIGLAAGSRNDVPAPQSDNDEQAPGFDNDKLAPAPSNEDDAAPSTSLNDESAEGLRRSKRQSRSWLTRWTDFTADSDDSDDVPVDDDSGSEFSPNIGAADKDFEASDDEGVTYQVVSDATLRRKSKLVDSEGYYYVKKYEKNDMVCWRCPVYGNKVKYCPVVVIQTADTFRRKKRHNHEKRDPKKTPSKRKRSIPATVDSVDKNQDGLESQALANGNGGDGNKGDLCGSNVGDLGGSNEGDLGSHDSSKTPKKKRRRRSLKQPKVEREERFVDASITYSVHEGGTQRGGDKLMDSLGFSYVSRKQTGDGKRLWRCAMYGNRKNSGITSCPVSVLQVGTAFSRSRKDHVHPKPERRVTVSRKRKIVTEIGPNGEVVTKTVRCYKEWKRSRFSLPSSDVKVSVSDMSLNESNGDMTVTLTAADLDSSMDVNEDVDEMILDDGVKYEVIRSCSTRGGDKLFDSRGFSYHYRHTAKSDNRVYWRCRGMGKVKYCPANVIQVGDKFYRSKIDHAHECNYGPVLTLAAPESELYQIAQEYLREHPPEAEPKPRIRKRSAATSKVQQPVDDTAEEEGEPDPNAEYRVVKACSMRGQDKLYDKTGYSYVIKHRRADGSIHWRCTVRNKTYSHCPASVVQSGREFMSFAGPHIHPPKDGQEVVEAVRMKLKAEVDRNPQKATSVIVTEVLEDFLQGMPCPNLPSLPRLHRIVNYHRAKSTGNSGAIVKVEPDDPRLKGYRLIGNKVELVFEDEMAVLTQEELEAAETTGTEQQVIESDIIWTDENNTGITLICRIDPAVTNVVQIQEL